MRETTTPEDKRAVKIEGQIVARHSRAVEVRQTGHTDTIIVPLAYAEVDPSPNGGCIVYMRRDQAAEIGFAV